MQTKHTPGPWFYNPDNDCIQSGHTDYEFMLIAKLATGENREEETANARLVASAPELLEACQHALLLDQVKDHPAVCALLKSAIAKATA